MAIQQVQRYQANEERKARPSGIVQEEEVQIEESQDLKSGVVQKEVV